MAIILLSLRCKRIGLGVLKKGTPSKKPRDDRGLELAKS